MPKILSRLIAICLLALVATKSLAHGDPTRPLFVSPGGVDAGLCTDAAKPCRSIDYALQWVGKGGQIRVASGIYRVDDAGTLFHLIGDVFEIRGAYRQDDGFRAPAAAPSTLLGVPSKYADKMRSKGFHVLADGKALRPEVLANAETLLQKHESLKAGVSNIDCINGSAGVFDCDKIDLLAHVALGDVSSNPTAGADVWGFVDLNTMREYAFMGYNIGTAVFDVTDPVNPREVGFIDGQNTFWRDIKVHQYWNAAAARFDAYAYITTDGSGDGLFVVDLTGLPHSVSRINYLSPFSAAHNVFATNTDFTTGLSLTGAAPALVIAGANTNGGRFEYYTLDDPRSPALLATPSASIASYMHDAASMLVSDSRKDADCVNAGSSPHCEVLFDFSVSTIDVWDITDPASPVLIANPSYPDAEYVHSGWWTEDKQFLFVNDELDEIRRPGTVPTTLVRVFSLADLSAPVEVGAWDGGSQEVDHNGFVRGNRYYLANYSRGLSILDISDPAVPSLAGFLDTFPGQQLNTIGAWGAYPFFPSGNIAVSDMNSGFYMLADRTLDVPQGRLGFAGDAFGGEEGSQLLVPVSRSGGASGAVSVRYELVAATGDAQDIGGGSGTLNWADGDTQDKLIALDLLNDGAAEGMQFALLRLIAPAGGATLGNSNVAPVFVAEPGAVASVQFRTNIETVAERGFGTAIAVVQRSGNAVGAVSIDYAIGAADAQAGIDFQGATAGTLVWNDGDATPRAIEFALEDDGVTEATEFFELVLSNATGATLGANATLRIEIADGTGSNTAPNANAGSARTVSGGSQVVLDGSASNDPDGDVLSYNWTQVAGTPVVLDNATSVNATFRAPNPASDTLLRFELSVADGGGLSDTALVSITVLGNNGGGRRSGGGAAGIWLLLLLGLLVVERMLLDNRLLAVRAR